MMPLHYVRDAYAASAQTTRCTEFPRSLFEEPNTLAPCAVDSAAEQASPRARMPRHGIELEPVVYLAWRGPKNQALAAHGPTLHPCMGVGTEARSHTLSGCLL